MFHLIKYFVLLVGLVTIAYFALPRFGYEVNMNYFNETKGECQKRLEACGKEYVQQGTKNANCDFKCVDPKLIISKQN